MMFLAMLYIPASGTWYRLHALGEKPDQRVEDLPDQRLEELQYQKQHQEEVNLKAEEEAVYHCMYHCMNLSKHFNLHQHWEE